MSNPDVGDDVVIERVRAGDVKAFETLVERHYPRALRYALRHLGSRCDAEEAVQDAFVRVHRFLDRYDGSDRFAAWTMAIVVNRCRTVGARRARNGQRFVSYDAVHDFVSSGWDERAAWRVEVQRALARLTDEEREALLLKYLDDFTYDEMARLTGSGVSALKMRVKRARERLQALLGRDYEG